MAQGYSMRSLCGMGNPYQHAPEVSIVRTDTCMNWFVLAPDCAAASCWMSCLSHSRSGRSASEYTVPTEKEAHHRHPMTASELMPTRRPSVETSGPPLSPGHSGASCETQM